MNLWGNLMEKKIILLFLTVFIFSILFLTGCKVQPVYNETVEKEQVKTIINTFYDAVKNQDVLKMESIVSTSANPPEIIKVYSSSLKFKTIEAKLGEPQLVINESGVLIGATITADFKGIYNVPEVEKVTGEVFIKEVKRFSLMRINNKWIIYSTDTLSKDDNLAEALDTLKYKDL